MSTRKEGFLKKQGHLRKNWKTRYFVLEDFMLSYYENKQSLKRALGKLFLQGGTVEVKGNSILVKAKFGTKKYLYISASTNEELQEWTEALQASIDSSVGVGTVKFSKVLLDFGLKNQTAELAKPIYDDFEVVNLSAKKLKFKFEPMHVKSYDLTFEPTSGVLPKYGRIPVKAKMVVNNPEIINGKAPLRVDADTAYLSFKCRGAGGVFGCDPASLPMEYDNGFHIPSILVQMKKSLLNNNALLSEGIFRLAGDAYDIKKVKESMNKNEFDLSSDVNTVASLVKIWFRELPVPILNVVPKEQLMNCGERQISLDSYASLPDLQKSLLDWLIDMLLVFAQNSAVNKMSLQNIAIVVAPNLYEPPDGNPMEGLILSQKCVQFFHYVMVWKNEHHAEGGGASSAPQSAVSSSNSTPSPGSRPPLQRVVSSPRPAIKPRAPQSPASPTPSRVATTPAPPPRSPASLKASSPLLNSIPSPSNPKAMSRQLSLHSPRALNKPPPPKTNHVRTTPQLLRQQQSSPSFAANTQHHAAANEGYGDSNGYDNNGYYYNEQNYEQQGYEYDNSYGYYEQGDYSEQY
eukprot:TRINITY_DN3044_c0_g1_i1.p1 TRINITY_DN3044_c0_g1~~TRINITY_DN3044_c0_g1_i1.p1  ORF type:complete len:575 (+),score=118.48 TRINITY_DN3044_c0_g1_i1:476-2200(+)